METWQYWGLIITIVFCAASITSAIKAHTARTLILFDRIMDLLLDRLRRP